MVEHTGYITLIDFGIAKKLKKGEQFTNTDCGTLEYKSYEQLK